MNIHELYCVKGEKPLDKIVIDGGFCGIFRSIGCIGDSLSSGEFERIDENGEKIYIDCFEYSWGQYIGRMTGAKVYNFSRGGMTAKEYCESFADAKDYWNPNKACQAYIIALGVNDIYNLNMEVGSVEDIDLKDWRNNRSTFAGYYGQIVQRLKLIQPEAKFFFMTMPREANKTDFQIGQGNAHASLLWDMQKKITNSYVIDFRKYAPLYDQEFRELYFLGGHMQPCGYMLTAKMVASYIDFLIRHNMNDFKKVGLIEEGKRWQKWQKAD